MLKAPAKPGSMSLIEYLTYLKRDLILLEGVSWGLDHAKLIHHVENMKRTMRQFIESEGITDPALMTRKQRQERDAHDRERSDTPGIGQRETPIP